MLAKRGMRDAFGLSSRVRGPGCCFGYRKYSRRSVAPPALTADDKAVVQGMVQQETSPLLKAIQEQGSIQGSLLKSLDDKLGYMTQNLQKLESKVGELETKLDTKLGELETKLVKVDDRVRDLAKDVVDVAKDVVALKTAAPRDVQIIISRMNLYLVVGLAAAAMGSGVQAFFVKALGGS